MMSPPRHENRDKEAALVGKERLSLSVLGASGSIGQSALSLIRAEPERFAVEALVAGSDTARLAMDAQAVGAKLAVVADPRGHADLAARLAGTGIQIASGKNAVIEAASRPVDVALAAISGAAGLAPSLAALRAARTLALANKETLVCAGALVMGEATRRGVFVLPVDSEHNAIFQLLDGRSREGVEEIILTASGGPFRGLSRAALAAVTPAMALDHPTWRMGRKISIDSATLMNKGLELIEAHYLFGIDPSRLSVLVHPQSVVHGLVRFSDGALLAGLGPADMRSPIAHCLAWPRRRPAPVAPLDLLMLKTLSFEAPDRVRFPCLALAEAALRRGQGAPTVLNAANEVAVGAFLEQKLGFSAIAEVVEAALDAAERTPRLLREPGSLEEAEALDAAGRRLGCEAILQRAA